MITYESYKYDGNKPVLLMVMGLVGSGKTELAQSVMVDRSGSLIKPVFAASEEEAKTALAQGNDVVFETATMSKKDRELFFKELDGIDRHVVSLCVLTPYEECLASGAAEEEVKASYLEFNPPAFIEGFQDIVYVYDYRNTDPSVYTMENFLSGSVNADEIGLDDGLHDMTIGAHIRKVVNLAKEEFPDNIDMQLAALLHDVGKPFTRSLYNHRGVLDTVYHYYNHQNCGSYDALFYLDVMDVTDAQKEHISNLVHYHMLPSTFWRLEMNAKYIIKIRVGKDMYDEMMQLYKTDQSAYKQGCYDLLDFEINK